MSAQSNVISAERFATAIHDLPAENLYSKAQELENSIAHLERSNRSLQEYVDSIRSDASLSEATRQEGDKECSEAIDENQVVIERQKERIDLLKREVERRGGRWHGANTDEKTNGTAPTATTNGDNIATERSAGGQRSDEEVLRGTLDRFGGTGGADDEDGMHL